MRAGATMIPVRRPYPAGPNSASGRVPREIVNSPLPAPWNSAKAAEQYRGVLELAPHGSREYQAAATLLKSQE